MRFDLGMMPGMRHLWHQEALSMPKLHAALHRRAARTGHHRLQVHRGQGPVRGLRRVRSPALPAAAGPVYRSRRSNCGSTRPFQTSCFPLQPFDPRYSLGRRTYWALNRSDASPDDLSFRKSLVGLKADCGSANNHSHSLIFRSHRAHGHISVAQKIFLGASATCSGVASRFSLPATVGRMSPCNDFHRRRHPGTNPS